MRRPAIIVVALCLVAVAVAALQGAPTFDPPRWAVDIPDIETSVPSGASAPPEMLAPTADPRTENSGVDLTPVLVALVVVTIAIIVALLVRLTRRSRPKTVPLGDLADASETLDAPSPADAGDVTVAVVRRGLDAARDRLSDEGDPNDAVVAAWRGLEETAADSGIERRASETPSEFTVSLLSRVPGAENDVRELLGLYLGVRYGGHSVDGAQIAHARSAVDRLHERWRS